MVALQHGSLLMGKIIAIIPARGGSKSIFKKNIIPFCGHPLIAHSIIIAKKTPLIDRVIVDTDSEEIAAIAQKYGAEIPYLRPHKLAQDLTPDLPVFQHALQFLYKEETTIDIVLHLRPTSPYRTVEKLIQAIELFKQDKRTTCVRGVIIPNQNPFKMWKIKKNGFMKPFIKTHGKEAFNMPRQKLPIVYWQIGNIDVIKPEVILKENSMTGNCIKPFIMEEIFSVDIDTPISLKIAEFILKPYLLAKA